MRLWFAYSSISTITNDCSNTHLGKILPQKQRETIPKYYRASLFNLLQTSWTRYCMTQTTHAKNANHQDKTCRLLIVGGMLKNVTVFREKLTVLEKNLYKQASAKVCQSEIILP